MKNKKPLAVIFRGLPCAMLALILLFVVNIYFLHEVIRFHFTFRFPGKKNSNPESVRIAGQAGFFYSCKETYAAAFSSSSPVGISSRTGVVLNMET